MTCGIYTITNLETNQIYVGQSKVVEYRWSQHRENPVKKLGDLLSNVENYKNIKYDILKEIPDYHIYEDGLVTFLLAIYEKHFIKYYKEESTYDCINIMNVVIPPAPLTILSYPHEDNLFDYITPMGLLDAMMNYLEVNNINLLDVWGDELARSKNLEDKYSQLLKNNRSEISRLNFRIKNLENDIDALTRYKDAFLEVRDKVNSF